MERYPRTCSVTGEGMHQGWCFNDGQEYAKYEEGAIKIAKEYGYDSIEEAYDDEAVYWTQWEDDDYDDEDE